MLLLLRLNKTNYLKKRYLSLAYKQNLETIITHILGTPFAYIILTYTNALKIILF